MIFGYNTNGFANHPLNEAIRIIAGLGYESVAITLDHHALNPFGDRITTEVRATRRLLRGLGLRSVVETGARFLLDPWRKHQPTLISPHAAERERRLDFLRRAVDIARGLGADAVTFWSGTPMEAASEVHWLRLVDGCRRLCEYAEARGIQLGFEPEPGMLVESTQQLAQLLDAIGTTRLGLTADVGHMHCVGETPIVDYLRRWRKRLCNVHLEDMCTGRHEHLMFGDGEIDVGPILAVLGELRYRRGVHVELSRHSHQAVEAARQALTFLRSALGRA